MWCKKQKKAQDQGQNEKDIKGLLYLKVSEEKWVNMWSTGYVRVENSNLLPKNTC